MTLRRRIVVVLGVMCCSLMAAFSLGVATAAAGTDTGWVPDGPYEDLDIKACGTTLTIQDVVNKVERRVRTDKRGNTRTDFRGRYIVKVSAPDGRKVVLNNSGPYSIFEFANGDVYIPVAPPALIFPFDAAEAAAFRAAGLPRVFYYTKGRLELYTHDGVVKVLTKPANPVSICALLHR